MSNSYPRVEVHSRAEWRHWLTDHHHESSGIWLVTHKKAAGPSHVPYNDGVEEALCFGWVDSVPRKLDETRSQLLLTPRKPTSRWSRANRERVERLMAAGQMMPPGIDLVEQAKAAGTWTALADVENLVEPTDLSAALDSLPSARSAWDNFPPSARRGILEWILSAKRAPTRAARISETAQLAARGERANQWRRKNSEASQSPTRALAQSTIPAGDRKRFANPSRPVHGFSTVDPQPKGIDAVKAPSMKACTGEPVNTMSLPRRVRSFAESWPGIER